jgi:glutaredoxin
MTSCTQNRAPDRAVRGLVAKLWLERRTDSNLLPTSSGRRTIARAGRLLRAMWFHRPAFRIHTVFAFLSLVSACKKSADPPPLPTAQAELPPREVSKDLALLFTYVEPSGMFATTDKADNVPEVTRRVVRVMGQAKGAVQRRNNANVEVIDLRELLAKGKTPPRVISREAFETSALAQLPPGDSCPLVGPHRPSVREKAEREGSPSELPIVILYGTPWCEACQAARRYLISNLIPFASKDIENDPSAARELQEKASRFGISADRVPILDVRGRLLVGYDQTRMDGFLADW